MPQGLCTDGPFCIDSVYPFLVMLPLKVVEFLKYQYFKKAFPYLKNSVTLIHSMVTIIIHQCPNELCIICDSKPQNVRIVTETGCVGLSHLSIPNT